MNTIGSILKSLRSNKNVTLEELANDLNKLYNIKLNKGMISKWESDKSEPRFEYAKYLAEYYNVTLDFLLGLDNKLITIIEDKNQKVSKEETELLSDFKKLNKIGKTKAKERIKELTMINTYTEYYLMPVAAHDKDGTISDEDIKHDIDIMNDDNEW